MPKEERETIADFMLLVIKKLYPNWMECPVADMREKEDSKGAGFEGTEYQVNDDLQTTYYMLKCAKEMLQIK